MTKKTTLLIVGAGPYGLSMAAYAGEHGIDYLLVGKPMEFWTSNMPGGMLLRSGSDWHLDPSEVHTLARYLGTVEAGHKEGEPISRGLFLRYAKWFREQKGIAPLPAFVQRLDRADGGFEARLEEGEAVRAKIVVIAPGFRDFKNVPEGLARILPSGRFAHTGEYVDFESLRHKRCLIVGGRQSAFEWAALIHEVGAMAVHVIHRHATPAFEPSDWSWVTGLVADTVKDPGWFRRLSPAEQDDIRHRFWVEGRLKLEPWLGPRVQTDGIRLWPFTEIASCRELSSGELEVKLDNGTMLVTDHVILATGYKVELGQISYLANGNILPELRAKDGSPALDEAFQTSVPGLFMTSFPATQDFGPFFGFVVGAPASATIMGRHIESRLASP